MLANYIYYFPTQPIYNTQPQQVYTDQPQTEQVFYDELSPYGQWIDYPDYGYVWHPNVDADFRPYVTDGNWVYTDYGWTWVSDFSWGWAPFHYGNWFYDDSYGWLWQPGQQWAPAWVTWGQSGDYYGWAPVPPQGYGGGGWRPRNEDWNFVQAQNIGTVNVRNYVVRNNAAITNNTTIINNVNTNNITNNRNTNTVIYNRGPRVTDVENITNTKIQQVKINGSARPGQSMANNQLNVYRPDIKPNASQGNAKPAPRKVMTYRQGNNQNPNQQNQRPNNGQGNNQNPGQQQNQTQDKSFSGMTQKPEHAVDKPKPETVLPNRQNQKQDNGRNHNQNPTLQQNQQPQKQAIGPENNQNHDQPLKKTLIMNQNPQQQPVRPPQQQVRPQQLVRPQPNQQPRKQPAPPKETPKPAKS